jgi:hypothetical protein
LEAAAVVVVLVAVEAAMVVTPASAPLRLQREVVLAEVLLVETQH